MFLVILENKHIYLLIKVSLCLMHHLIWFIVIFKALTLFPLWGLIILLFFLMIIFVILGYTYYSITLNSLKFIKIFIKRYKPSFLIQSNFFVQIMLWSIMKNLLNFFKTKWDPLSSFLPLHFSTKQVCRTQTSSHLRHC
jgi:hypothetical protein